MPGRHVASCAFTALLPQAAPQKQPESDEGQWVMPARNYANTRYSGLDQINTGNAGKLQPAWTCTS